MLNTIIRGQVKRISGKHHRTDDGLGPAGADNSLRHVRRHVTADRLAQESRRMAEHPT